MKSTGLKFGFLTGLITVAYFTAFYLINPRLMLHPVVWWSSLLFYLAGMYYAIERQQAEGGELLSFRAAITPAFQVFVIANALFFIFYYLLFAVVDPSLVTIQEEMMKARADWLDGADLPDLTVTLKKTFFDFAYSLIGGFVLAAMVAAFLTRNNWG